MTQPAPTVQYAGVGVVGADQYNTYTQVCLNYAQMRTFSGLSNMAVVALGSSSPNDGGQAVYYWNSTSTAADNGGTIIVPTGNLVGAWIQIIASSAFVIPHIPGDLVTDGLGNLFISPVYEAAAFGMIAGGSVDNSAALNAIFAAVGVTGGKVHIPAGIWRVNAASLSIANGKSVTFVGDGADVTILTSPLGTSPITITLASAYSTFHFRDFTVTTGAENLGTAIAVSGGATSSASSDFMNVTVRGSDGTNETINYFNVGIAVTSVSNILFFNVTMPGNTSKGGYGVSLTGNVSTSAYGIIYNFIGCTLNFMGVGLLYNSYIQGVQLGNCNFTGNNYGIFIPVGATGNLYELVVSSSQFQNVIGDIWANTLLSDVNISSSQFGPYTTTTEYSIQGVFKGATFVGNTFVCATGGTGDGAIVTQSGSDSIVVTGNAFIGTWSTAVIFQSVTTNANLQSNIYNGPANKSSPASTTGSIQIGGGSS